MTLCARCQSDITQRKHERERRFKTVIDDQVDASVDDQDEQVEHDWQSYHEFLTEGVSVLYVMADGQERPATVVRAWKSADAPDMVNLVVFLDGNNDRTNIPYNVLPRADGMLHWATSVHYAPPEDKKAGTWHYMDEDESEDEDPPDSVPYGALFNES